MGLTNEKIEYKMNELQYKIEVESRIRDGAAKLIESIQSDERRKGAEASLNFSKAKINLLRSSLKNYESLLISSSSKNDNGTYD